MLHPTACRSEADVFDEDVTTVFEIDVLGSGAVFVFEIYSLAVDDAASSDCDVFEAFACYDGPVAECLIVGAFELAGRAVVGFVLAA